MSRLRGPNFEVRACFGLESQLETQETQMGPMELENLVGIVSQVNPKLEIWLFQKFLS